MSEPTSGRVQTPECAACGGPCRTPYCQTCGDEHAPGDCAESGRVPSSEWVTLWRFRTPVDPDYGGPTSTATLWRDNLGGLVLGMDVGDGERVVVLPLPADDATDLAAAIVEHLTTPARTLTLDTPHHDA
ncbi:MAG: hypothetical protein ACXVHX_39120 [Solirubrobacteraceae bacterium]